MTQHQLSPEDRGILCDLLAFYERAEELPRRTEFRVRHEQNRRALDQLEKDGLLTVSVDRQALSLDGLRACPSPESQLVLSRLDTLVEELKRAYRAQPDHMWSALELSNSSESRLSASEVARLSTLLVGAGVFGSWKLAPSGFIDGFKLTEAVLEADLASPGAELDTESLSLSGVSIRGYRPFAAVDLSLGALTVVVGANAAGKSSLMQALALLTHAATEPFPAEIAPNLPPGARVFHADSENRLAVVVTMSLGDSSQGVRYELELAGPVGSPRVVKERLGALSAPDEGIDSTTAYLEFAGSQGVIRRRGGGVERARWRLKPNEAAIRRCLDPTLGLPTSLQAYFASWSFYYGFDVGPASRTRQPCISEEHPTLLPDGSNLSAVVHDMVLSDPEGKEELESLLAAAVPGFVGLGVKSVARGQVLAVWKERGTGELTMADLSDGALRLLAWFTLLTSRALPPLVCIDEPELGLHPRALPIVAGACKVASARSQLIVSTHSPQFLSEFSFEDIAVMRREDGRVEIVRPASREALRREVEEFGGEAIARLFVSDELEGRS